MLISAYSPSVLDSIVGQFLGSTEFHCLSALRDSDKCTVCKSADPRRIWVFRSSHEKWLADCIQPRGKSNDIQRYRA